MKLKGEGCNMEGSKINQNNDYEGVTMGDVCILKTIIITMFLLVHFY